MSSLRLTDLFLERVAERPIEASPRRSPANCFVSETPFPEIVPTLDRFCTVSADDGVFDESVRTGGAALLVERLGVCVTLFRQTIQGPSRGFAEAPGESQQAQREATLAILIEPWTPTHAGRRLLIEPLAPRRSLALKTYRTPQGATYLGAGLLFEAALDRT